MIPLFRCSLCFRAMRAAEAVEHEGSCERARQAGCPHPLDRRTVMYENDDMFHPQEGCLDCDEWLEPLRRKDR